VTISVAAQPVSIPTIGAAQVTATTTRSGVPVAGLVVLLSTSIGSLDAAQVVTDAQGRATTTLRGIGTTGTATITAAIQGMPGTATTDVRIGLDRFLGISAQPTAIAGTQQAVVQALLVEGNGTPVARALVTFATTLGRLGDTTVTTDGRGIATTTLTAGDRLGTAHVTASVPSVQTVETAVLLLPTYRLRLQTSAAEITPSGSCTITIRVDPVDPHASVDRLEIHLVSSLGRIGTPVRTDRTGVASSTLTADGRTGTAVVTATLQGGTADAATVSVLIR